MPTADDLVERTVEALATGALEAHQLTARHLGAYLGKTSSVLYHHWGSLDGFLHAVSQAGFARLGGRVVAELDCTTEHAHGALLEHVALSFVTFGLDHPLLYHVMFERKYDWDALRAAGAFEREMPGSTLWTAALGYFAGAGSTDPDGDARVFYAGMHGLVTLANSGRANVGRLATSDRQTALEAARKLARRLTPTSQETTSP